MAAEFQVQKVGLQGDNWATVYRGDENKARTIYERQLRLHTIGRFRLLDGSGKVLDEQKAVPLFSSN